MSQAPEDVRTIIEHGVAQWAAAKREGTLSAVLEALYDHEINVGLQSFWDGGWTVWIGDDMNGHLAELGVERDEFHRITPWLIDVAERRFPALLGNR